MTIIPIGWHVTGIEGSQIAVRIWFTTKISSRNIRIRLVYKDRSSLIVRIRSRTDIRKLLTINWSNRHQIPIGTAGKSVLTFALLSNFRVLWEKCRRCKYGGASFCPLPSLPTNDWRVTQFWKVIASKLYYSLTDFAELIQAVTMDFRDDVKEMWSYRPYRR